MQLRQRDGGGSRAAALAMRGARAGREAGEELALSGWTLSLGYTIPGKLAIVVIIVAMLS